MATSGDRSLSPGRAGASSPSRKRRRSPSASPPPRPKSPPGEASASFYPSSASFNPASLTGQEATEWRSLVLRDMFRGTHFEPAPPPQPPASPSGRRIASPAYLPQPLPPFERRRGLQALSYLVVGPRLRGKFLPEKARAAGVKPGKAFAKLVNGERVWVRAAPEPAKPQPAEAATNGEDAKKKETKKERKARERREAEAQAKDEGVEGEGEGRWVEPEECMSAGQDGTVRPISRVPPRVGPTHAGLTCRLSLSSTSRLQRTCPTSTLCFGRTCSSPRRSGRKRSFAARFSSWDREFCLPRACRPTSLRCVPPFPTSASTFPRPTLSRPARTK